MFKTQFTFRRKKGISGQEDTSTLQHEGKKPELEGQTTRVDDLPVSTYRPAKGQTSLSTSLLETRPLIRVDASHTSKRSLTSEATTIARPQLGEAAGHTQDPQGLKVVYRPVKDRKADIIFVHGLGGSSRATWSKDHNAGFFWPGLLLPYERDICDARIFTFGYNASFRPSHRKNKNVSILDFAKELLYELRFAKDDSDPELEDFGMGKKPIIFVAHSMGGLIVKEAYIQGQHDPVYQDIIKAVTSIIFLSTPHRGTNLAETLNRILQVSLVASPMQFISELVGGSQALQRLNEQFRHIAPKLRIISLYETRPTPVLRSKIMVLDKDSSVLGYPGEVSKPLDADHHGVCKFDGPDDPGYVTVRNIIMSLVGDGTPANTTVTKQDTVPRSMCDFEEKLSVSESPENDYNFFHDRWVPGTCQWILKDEVFIAWRDDVVPKPQVLWIHGNAASGKSILSSFVINHLFHMGLPCHYFFIRFTHLKKRALNNVLRSLSSQLARSVPKYADKLCQMESAFTDLKSAEYRTLWQWLFVQSLLHLNIRSPLYLVIDGVDEADNPASLIKLLSELHDTTVPLRVLLVGRKTHEISSAVQKLGRQIDTKIIRIEGNMADFRLYINQEMDLAGNVSYHEAVTDKLLDRARGNFLWLHLAVQKINNCYTKPDVESALDDLPSGMEALYSRMASGVVSASQPNGQKLGHNILGWVTCAQRTLTLEELSDALNNDGILEIQRAVGDLCGGFAVLDHEGKVVMIHETAKEYLLRPPDRDRTLSIESKTTNDLLFKRCITCLTHPSLRNHINRNQVPPLLEYAASTWFIHLSLGTITDPDILEAVIAFLQGPSVLIWIFVAARNKVLKTLVMASRYLTDVGTRLRKVLGNDLSGGRHAEHHILHLAEGWATDLIKIVGKFGSNLRRYPESIFKLVPPFCPSGSLIYQQFGRKESKALHVSGAVSTTWDDCLARFSLDSGAVASAVLAAGSRIAILINIRKTSQIIIYSSATFEEQRRIIHPERVLMIQASTLGDLIVSYGYLTTRVWDMSTGECVKLVQNPVKRPRPHTILFNERTVLVANEDRCIRTFALDDKATEWQTLSHIDEECLEFTTVNFPICSAFSPDGNRVAFGYRGHPATAWEVNHPPMLLGQCNIGLVSTDMTIQDSTWGEVFRVVWHPSSGEVLGLTQVGLLFKWDPYEEQPSTTVQTGADYIAISRDGSLVATGDGVGTIKILSYAGFSLLYRLSSQDPVVHLSFSTDSRRLYDVRGAYGSAWEPDVLVRLADNIENSDQNGDVVSYPLGLAQHAVQTEHRFARVDNVIAVAGQPVGPLYCYGTEDGVAILSEVGYGNVCDLERSRSYMCIEKIAWSEDGRLVAILDLSGKLLIRRILKQERNRTAWEVSQESDFVIPTDKGHITQLLFHPSRHGLLATTFSTLFSIDLDSGSVTESILHGAISELKWVFHPILRDYLLGFGNTSVQILEWPVLRDPELHTYFPPRLAKPMPIPGDDRTSSIREERESLGRLICHADSSHVFLEIRQQSMASHQTHSQYLLFNLEDMKLDESEPRKNELCYTQVPEDVACHIREPLAFLSRRRLVFLDTERWISTWHFPVPGAQKTHAVGQQQGGILQYYFLPGDWIANDETHICVVMADGTLLCPRNGDVVTVQCAKLRK